MVPGTSEMIISLEMLFEFCSPKMARRNTVTICARSKNDVFL